MNTDELCQEIDELLEEYNISYSLGDMENLTFDNIFQSLHDVLVSRMTAPFVFLGIITAVIIFTSFMKSMNSSVIADKSGIADIISVLTSVAVLTQPLMSLYSEVCETVIKCGEFINLFVPIFTSICVLSGSISAIGTYNFIVMGVSQIIVWTSDNYLMPLLTAITALSVTGSVYSHKFSESIVKFISSAVKWILTVSMGIFVGFLTLKSTVGAASDTFATKTVKFVISGCVPVVGSAVSDAYATVKGGIGILRGSAGMAGILALIIIFVPPVVEVVSLRIVMKTGVVLADMFSADTVGKLLKSLESGLSMALSIMICFAVLFIISTAILMKTSSV